MIDELIYLGIETSCDDTAVSVFNNTKNIISEYIITQKIHKLYGGTVPELAARDHLKYTLKLILYILKIAKIKINKIKCIAYTQGPGLKGALLIGISIAKTISLLLKIPNIGINHLEAHIMINFNFCKKKILPALVLLISGAHTIMLNMTKYNLLNMIGESSDDGAGESFDKIARLFDLTPANGISIEKNIPYRFVYNNEKIIKTKQNIKHYNFSFSGIKSNIMKLKTENNNLNMKNIIYNFQNTIINIFTTRIRNILSTNLSYKGIIIGGGVSANKEIRIAIRNISEEFNIEFNKLPKKYCTDNGSMIAFLGFIKINNNKRDYKLSIKAVPNLRII